MAKRNIEEYNRILAILESGEYKDKDGYISLNDIESVFVAVSDKVRPETIKTHIVQMCRLKLLSKKGDVSYKISENWRDVISRFA